MLDGGIITQSGTVEEIIEEGFSHRYFIEFSSEEMAEAAGNLLGINRIGRKMIVEKEKLEDINVILLLLLDQHIEIASFGKEGNLEKAIFK